MRPDLVYYPHSQLATHNSLLTTHYLRYSLLTTHYLLLVLTAYYLLDNGSTKCVPDRATAQLTPGQGKGRASSVTVSLACLTGSLAYYSYQVQPQPHDDLL